jgi:hypothetical protein
MLPLSTLMARVTQLIIAVTRLDAAVRCLLIAGDLMLVEARHPRRLCAFEGFACAQGQMPAPGAQRDKLWVSRVLALFDGRPDLTAGDPCA